MHKIVKALELASQERAARIGTAAAESRLVATPAAVEHLTVETSLPVESAAAEVVAKQQPRERRETICVRVSPGLLEQNRILTGAGEDSATRAVKLLRTQVLRRLDDRGWRSVAVVSPSAGEGKTLTAINLGIALASLPQRTALLVDLDWRHPSVHRYFGIEPAHDVISYLDGQHALSEVLINPGIPRFCIAPCRTAVKGAAERLGSPGLRGFHDELRSRYTNRIVLFDLPPLLATDDALSFLPNVDAVLVVIEEGETRREDLVCAIELIDPSRFLGTVINKSSSAPPEY